ncbi:MAG TPA: hypothetical protein VLH61_01145 [Bacteroidales bacterium]|nr:hypothetical protein [Bacteroidales bacterium]
MTKETEAKLIDNTEKSIEYVSKAIDEVRGFLRKKAKAMEFLESHNINTENETFETMEKMLEYRMLIGIIFLDLASATRAHLNSKFTYEKLFSMRQIIVIINEGYKQIYNFVRENENGDLITRDRNKSFWHKDIRNVVTNALPELTNEYDNLTQKLEKYFNDNFSSIKEQRDLSVHYDKVASKVYDMSVGLNVEQTFLKMSPFLGILTEMFRFTEKMALIASIKEKQKKQVANTQIEEMFDNLLAKVESAKTDENEKKVNELLDMIKKSKQDIMEKIKSPNT